jgi:alpha-N-acetylglucosaminidase
MSWTFYYDSEHWTQERLKAMVESVPKGKLIFLDYVAEEEEFYKRTENFFGAPFIWCYLGNFGGNTHLVAPMKKVSKRIVEAQKVENCLGVGATLEGLNVNPEIYEMVLEIPCNNKISSFDIDEWIKNYAVRRAGQEDSAVIEAWKLLKEKVLVDEAQVIGNHSVVFQVLPVMDLKESSWTTNPFVPYDNADLAKALQIMLQANEESRKNDAYCFDVVNLARQALGNYGSCLYEKMMTAYREQNLSDFQKYSHQFISLGMEIDLLLGTRKEFLLGSWLSDARRWGKTREEKIYYERNAREIITTWHKSGGELVDYANRQWNGLMRSYYLPRWEKFIELLQKSLINGTSFEQEDFSAWCIDFERKWVNGEIQENFLEKPSGNAIETAQRLFEKYSTEMLK